MRVRVLYFGVLKDLCSCDGEAVELPEGALAEVLVRRVVESGERGAALGNALAIAVNREYARGSVVLHDGDEVALLPPVSGGRFARAEENDAR